MKIDLYRETESERTAGHNRKPQSISIQTYESHMASSSIFELRQVGPSPVLTARIIYMTLGLIYDPSVKHT